MSTYVPDIPKDGKIYTLKGLNGGAYWEEQSGQTQIVQPEQPVMKRKMLITAGQSNCQSSNDGSLTEEEKKSNPKIKSYYRGISTTYNGKPITNYPILPKGSIGPAIDPLQHHGISDPNSVGFVRTFCEAYLKDNPNTEITIVPCALGGTGFNPSTGYVITWDKTIQANLNLYNEMINDCNNVLKQYPDMEVIGCLFHQGENDIGNWQYPTKLDKLVRDMRIDLWNGKGGNMPFICGTMLKSWKDLNSATKYIDDAHKNIQWRFNDGLTACSWFDWITLPPYDDGMSVHFNAQAQRYMGMGFYDTYKKLPGLSNSKEIEIVNVDLRSIEKSEMNENMSFDEICKYLAENEGKISK